MTWEIITGDCLPWMRARESGSIDCVVTDPPYGIGEAAGKNKGRGLLAEPRDYGNEQWDNDRLVLHVDTARRIGREAVIFGGNYYADIFPPSSSWISWDKDNGGTDFADVELAWTSHRRAARRVKWRWNGMLQQPGAPRDRREHPTQKPVGVMLWIIENYTSPGETILDPFCGSGTTGVACIRTGRNFIGIEINPEYADIARRRCEEAERQGDLFVKQPVAKPEQLVIK